MSQGDPIFKAALALREAGVAIHWLAPRSKRPFTDGWAALPVASMDELSATWRPGYNAGVRPGEPSRIDGFYLHLLDLDIRVAERADEVWDALLAMWPDARAFPMVQSGSGGESRHIYFLSREPYRSKKIAHSAAKHFGTDGKSHWDWEIELFGTGKQAVIPPSIHPDTGKPYVWLSRIDLSDMDVGLGPIIKPEHMDALLDGDGSPGASSAVLDDEDDLLSFTRAQPLGLSEDEIQRTLKDLPVADWCDDRDGWLKVGMALHHEYQGTPAGLAAWNAFSKQSDKFDVKDQERVWKSFRTRPVSVRMPTLVKAASMERLRRGFEEDEAPPAKGGFVEDDPLADDDDNDILGTPSTKVEVMDLEETRSADMNWMSRLELNDEGAIKPTLHNVSLIVRFDPRTLGVMALNEFTQEIVQVRAPGKKSGTSPKGIKQLGGPVWRLPDNTNGSLWSESHDNAIRDMLEAPTRQGGYAFKITDRDLKAAVDMAAQHHRFHPVREYLEKLEWDGVKRAENLFHRFLGSPNSAYTRAVSALMLLGAVVRVFEPGHKFDFAVILEGLQGKRKSSFIKVLARDWFSELDGDFHDTKAMVELMQGSWIMEIPELQGFGRADVRAIKAFISRQVDKTRLAYERRAKEYPRQCIFIGSTNDSEYLRDETGGRRFWPVECHVDEIDTDGLETVMDQIWAEALVMYRDLRKKHPRGTLPLYLSDAEAQAVAKEMQEARRVETVEDSLSGRIAAWLDSPVMRSASFDDDEDDDLLGSTQTVSTMRNMTCLTQIWRDCLGNDLQRYDPRAAAQIGAAMKRLSNWVSIGRQHTKTMGRQRLYARKDSAATKGGVWTPEF